MALLGLILIIVIMTAGIMYASNREMGGHISPKLKVFALSTALTVIAFSAYFFGGVIIEEASDNDGFTWATFTATIVIWLLVLGVLAIRARMSVLWVALGGVAGFVLSPVIVLVVLLITWALFRWPVLMD